MANLIPQATLKAHGRDIMSRMICTGACAITFCAGALSLGILPAYFDMHAERVARETALAALQSSMKGSERSDRNLLTDIRKRASALERIGKGQQLADALSAAIANRPHEVTLRSFVYSRKDGVSSLAVSGSVSGAAAFRQYTEALKGTAPVDKVVVPLTSLIGGEGGSFTFIMNGSF